MIKINEFGVKTKWCPACCNDIPIENFTKNKSNKSGLGTYCKKCASAIVTAEYAKNPEKFRDRKNRYRLDNLEKCRANSRMRYAKNPEKFRDGTRKWRAEHPEKVKEYNDLYSSLNKDKIRIQHAIHYKNNSDAIKIRVKEYAKDHLEEIMMNVTKRRILKKNAQICDLTYKQWIRVLESYDYRCAYCGTGEEKMTQDHVVPIERHGNHTMSNVVPACIHCNCSKQDKFVEEWVAAGGFPLHAPYRESFGGEAV